MFKFMVFFALVSIAAQIQAVREMVEREQLVDQRVDCILRSKL